MRIIILHRSARVALSNGIALALIRQLVANGTLDAADIQAITRNMPERDASRVKAAWLVGMTGSPELEVINGGK